MAKDILLIGGGGHCSSVIDVIEQEGSYQVKGILDIAEKVGQQRMGYDIIGTEDDLPKLLKDTPHCLITIGQVGSAQLRSRLYHQLKAAGAQLPVIVSPTAYVSPHARLGEGTVVMHQACVNAGAVIGVNNIINSRALVEHEARTGAHCHLSTAAILNGACALGDEVLIGSCSALRQQVKIADGILVGMGSVVLEDLSEPGIYAGVPARKIK